MKQYIKILACAGMTMLKIGGLLKNPRSLKSENGGSVLIMTAMVILLLFAVGGAGVDFGRAQLVKMKAQQASDLAALAAANTVISNPTANDRIKSANLYYNLNFPSSYLGVDRPAIKYTSDNILKVAIDATAKVDTNFIRAGSGGMQSINVASGTKVDIETKTPRYDVIMVLDVSDSMDWRFDGKMCGDGGVTPCNNNDGNPATAGLPYCFDWIDNVPNSGDFYSCGEHATPSDLDSRLSALKIAARSLTDALFDPKWNGSNKIAGISWNNQLRSSFGFTGNKNTVYTFLDNLKGSDSTNSTAGLTQAKAWASNFRLDAVPIIILLTDGENNGNGGPHDLTVDASSVAICKDFKENMNPRAIVYTIALGSAVEKSTDGTFLKAEGIHIDSFLRNCASGDPKQNGPPSVSGIAQYYFVAPSGAELKTIFEYIANKTQNLRITE